jgi:hypothetical protein
MYYYLDLESLKLDKEIQFMPRAQCHKEDHLLGHNVNHQGEAGEKAYVQAHVMKSREM